MSRSLWQILVANPAGFLIVPALVLLGGLPMHLAIGTSLTIITLQSFSGFAKYLDVLRDLDQALDWTVLGTLLVMAGAMLVAIVVELRGSLPGGMRCDPYECREMGARVLVLAPESRRSPTLQNPFRTSPA